MIDFALYRSSGELAGRHEANLEGDYFHHLFQRGGRYSSSGHPVLWIPPSFHVVLWVVVVVRSHLALTGWGWESTYSLSGD